MSEVLFNTTEVAKMLQVNKSTVKRWTDEGKLSCFRTPGGHRKFRAEDLYQFMSDFNYGVATLEILPQFANDAAVLRRIIAEKDHRILKSVCFSSAIKGKKEDVLKVFSEAYRAGMSLHVLFDEILIPTLKRINDASSSGKISLSEVKLSINVLSTSIVLLKDVIVKTSSKNKTVICASFENESENIELRAVELLFESNGFDVMNIGANVTDEILIQLLQKNTPHVICLYAATLHDREQVKQSVVRILSVTTPLQLKVILGGAGYESLSTEFADEQSVQYCKTFNEFSLIQFSTKTTV